MNIELIADGSFQRTLKVTVPASAVGEQLDRAYRDLGKRARLRGFRAGKAPRKVLEARFGAQVLSDVAADLIQKAYSDGLTQHELEPVSRPRVDREEEPSKGQDFHFAINVEVKPSIELGTYTGVDVYYPKAEVADEELDQAVQGRLQQSRRLVEVTDRAVEEGDQVMVELKVLDGKEEVAFEPGTMVQTAGDSYYKGVESLIIGLKKDKKKKGDVTFADDAKVESVAGKTLKVEAKVLSIQAYEVPELNDELAKELGFEGGADGMRLAIQGELQAGRDEMARNQARANLLQVLIEKNEFSVPSGLVDQQLDVLLNELRMQQAYRGVDPRQVHFSEAQLADLRVRSEFAVKGGLILDFVTRTHDLKVEDADIERKLKALADERGQEVDAIRSYFETDEAMNELRDRLLEEKSLDWLLENANIVDTAPEPAAAPEPKAKAKKKPVAKKEAKKAADKPEAKKEAKKADKKPAASGDAPSADDIDGADRAQILAWAEAAGMEPKGRTDKLKRDLKKHHHG
ncbi:MAG: trigger factor [Myxococcota bacterium]